MKRKFFIFLILMFCGAAGLSCGQAAVPDLPEEDLVRTEADVEDGSAVAKSDDSERQEIEARIRFKAAVESKSTEGVSAEEIDQYFWEYMDESVIWEKQYELFGEDNHPDYHTGGFEDMGEGSFRNRMELFGEKENDTEQEYTTMDIIINPDFSISIPDDGVREGTRTYFGMRPAGKQYDRDGYRIKEYVCAQKVDQTDTYITVTLPQIRGERAYDYGRVNWQIRTGIIGYLEQKGLEGMTATVGYEIKTLDDNIISVAYYIAYLGEDDVKTLDCAGVSVSMGGEDCLPLSALRRTEGREESQYYIEDGNLVLIDKAADGYTLRREKMGRFQPYYYEEVEQRIAEKKGLERWRPVEDVYAFERYEVPILEETTEGARAANQNLWAEWFGTFIRTRGKESRESTLEYQRETLDKGWLIDGPSDERVECEVTCNRNGYLSMKVAHSGLLFMEGFNYNVDTGRKLELTDVLDMPAGEINEAVKAAVLADMESKKELWLSYYVWREIEESDIMEARAKVEGCELADWSFYFTNDKVYIYYGNIVGSELEFPKDVVALENVKAW